ncbi:AlbA family DNA-binding domain-containing protein [Derxia lacustris]|uniref:AlbA family DNA-binding domain-containing protein n=1 Tax=Derxia lacustris TaxID=764842 RepID=UPI001C39161D|nr:ATP-binding protein [Derxia lacustris]
MSLEGQLPDRKSLRAVTGKTADWSELAKDCVAFANALGGRLLIGIGDGEELPPQGQRIPPELPDALRRRLGELTVNVAVQPELLRTLDFPAVTTLKRIEDHRLRALVLEDLGRYPGSPIGDVHRRIGEEIPRRRLRSVLSELMAAGAVRIAGRLRSARYFLAG